MADKISIASAALILVGEESISSFTDTGAGAAAVSALYDSTYESLLAGHRWTFATGKVQLSKLAASPLNEWQNAFQIPQNKKIIHIYGVYPDSPYSIFEDKVYSNNNNVAINFVFRVDESKLPQHVVLALQHKLASELAITLTDDNTLADVYAQKAIDSLSMAKGIDSQSRSSQPIQSSPFIDVR